MEKTLEEKAWELIGFQIVSEKGSCLNEEEIQTISEYSESCGADKKYVKEILENKGRPFSLFDSTFTTKCGICNTLRNYCCC